jgi:hypothetical protein
VSTFTFLDGHGEQHKWVNAKFNNPGAKPLPEGDQFWHSSHGGTPLPGVGDVKTDFKWLHNHASEKR